MDDDAERDMQNFDAVRSVSIFCVCFRSPRFVLHILACLYCFTLFVASFIVVRIVSFSRFMPQKLNHTGVRTLELCRVQ